MNKLIFREMYSPEDFQLYENLSKKYMKPEDFYTGSELQNLIDNGIAIAWFCCIDNKKIGLCAIKKPSCYHPDKNSIHILDGLILPDYRNLGYGKQIVQFIMNQYPNKPFVVSIQPDNIISQNTVKHFGFIKGPYHHPWFNWYYPNIPNF